MTQTYIHRHIDKRRGTSASSPTTERHRKTYRHADRRIDIQISTEGHTDKRPPDRQRDRRTRIQMDTDRYTYTYKRRGNLSILPDRQRQPQTDRQHRHTDKRRVNLSVLPYRQRATEKYIQTDGQAYKIDTDIHRRTDKEGGT